MSRKNALKMNAINLTPYADPERECEASPQGDCFVSIPANYGFLAKTSLY